MSSSFSYELDEEQIRSTLLDGGMQEPMESAWEDFEANFMQNVTVQNSIKFKLPEFNLNINRNIVLPAMFILGLVGVSAILLSFVDFKTNAPAQVEKALVPDPDNYKGEETKAAVLVKKEPEKTVAKPEVKKDTVPVQPQNGVVPPVNSPSQMVVNTPSVQNNAAAANTNYTSRNTSNQVTNTQSEPSVSPAADTLSKANTGNFMNTTSQNYGRGRKKRSKLPPEQIETIKAPSILGTEAVKKEEEPEMEIKLD